MEEILEFSLSNISDITVTGVLISTISASILAFFIILIYRMTYSGVAYNTKFALSLGMITIITSLIMNVISNNIALSLGLVGALSIIRFRTVIKDIVDATYLFWAIAVGIACGVYQLVPAAIVSVNLVIFQLILRKFRKDDLFMLIIRSNIADQSKIIDIAENYFTSKIKLRVRSKNQSTGDIIYEITQKQIKDSEKKQGLHIIDKLSDVTGVISVDLVEHTDNLMH